MSNWNTILNPAWSFILYSNFHAMNGSTKISTYHNRSLPTALLQLLIRPFVFLISKPGKPLPSGSPQLKPPASVALQYNVFELLIDEVWLYDLTAKSHEVDRNNQDRTRRVYYTAGGSFRMPPLSDHWKFLTELSEEIPDAVISLISPPLAPHSPAPLIFPRLVKLSKTLLSSEEDERVTFVGDSSATLLEERLSWL